MTKKFKHGIEVQRIKKAKIFFEDTDAGDAIQKGVKAGELFVCIRDGYFTVYRNGCALLKYNPNARDHKFVIHKKYFPDATAFRQDTGEKREYASLDLLDNGDDLSKIFIEDIIKSPNANLKKYLCDKNKNVDSEKELLQAYLETEKPCLIDLEVAFSCKIDPDKVKKRETVAKRVDLGVLEKDGEKVMLRFIEAKVVSDSRLKAEEKDPEVIGQLELYETFLKSEKVEILDSYKCVAKNFINDFPYLIENSDHKDMMEEFIKSGKLFEKPSLLLLAGSGKCIKESMRGTKGKNNGNHYQTLMDCCRGKWDVLEWVNFD